MQITDEMVMAALAAFHKSPDWFDDYDADDAAVLRHDMQAALKAARSAAPAEPDARSAALEEAAQLIEANCVVTCLYGQRLAPRIDGNHSGLAYATAIRALAGAENQKTGGDA